MQMKETTIRPIELLILTTTAANTVQITVQIYSDIVQ